MDKLAKWWLQRRGYYLVPPGFIGVLLGNQTALFREDGILIISNGMHGEIVALNHSIIMQLEK